MKRAAFVYDPQLSTHVLREDHVLRPTRLQYTYELLEAYGAFQPQHSMLVAPRPATQREILRFHTHDYLEAVQSFSLGETGRFSPAVFNFSEDGDNPTYPGMYEAALLSTGASLVAAELVVAGEVEVAFNVSGGLHHAAPDHASGFCIFNDPVIAIQSILDHGKRVAYVDIDCHHGDGVQAAFYTTNQVLTISLHESGRWLFPGSGEVSETGSGQGRGYSVNVPLAPLTSDDIYVWAFREVVPPLLQAFKPDVLVTQLGVDTHYHDPITHLSLTTEAFAACIQEFRKLGLPWVALGGGGYDISAVARCWALAYGVMAGLDLPNLIPPAYQETYGLKSLLDAEKPGLDAAKGAQAQHFAESSVQEVKRLLFPLHGLSQA